MWTAWKATPILSRMCAHCCSGLSAANGSADQCRILVGPDAHKIDELVHWSPERAYDVDFSSSSCARSAGACLPDIAPHTALTHRRRSRRGGPIWIGARKQGRYT